MDLRALLGLLPARASQAATPTVSLRFEPPLSAAQREVLRWQPLTLTVVNTTQNAQDNSTLLTLQAPDGLVLRAVASPALPVGSQLQLSVAAEDAAAVPVVLAKLLPPNPTNAAVTAALPPAEAPADAAAVGSKTPENQATGQAVPKLSGAAETAALAGSKMTAPVPMVAVVVPGAAIAAETVQLVTQNATATVLSTAAPPVTTGLPGPPLPLPTGPVGVQLPASTLQAWAGERVQLTALPGGKDGWQPVTVSLVSNPAQRVPGQVQAGVPLPVQQPLAGVLLAPAPLATAPLTPLAQGPGVGTPSQPVPTPTGGGSAVPRALPGPTAPAPREATVLLTTPVPVPQTSTPSGMSLPLDQLRVLGVTLPDTANAGQLAPVVARVVGPATLVPMRGVVQQPLLLATGQRAQLEWDLPPPPAGTPPLAPARPTAAPAGVATGSVLVVEFPTLSSAAVTKIASVGNQPTANGGATATPQPGTPVAPPVPTATAAALLPPGTVLSGQVVGQNAQGQVLLQVSGPLPQAAPLLQRLQGQPLAVTLAPTMPAPVLGATLTVRLDESTALVVGQTLTPAGLRGQAVSTLGSSWPGLQQATQLLQQQAPAQAAALRNQLPQLANLLPGVLQVMHALRTNRAEDLVGPQTVALLKALGVDLGPDVQLLHHLQQRQPEQAQEWRGALFPYVEGPQDDPRQGGFFWRREQHDDPRAPAATRFVVEVNLSQLGPLQLDGLVTYPDVWLKLRSLHSLPPEVRQELPNVVQQLLQQFGLHGGLAVEQVGGFPVDPRAEILQSAQAPLPTEA